MCEWFDLFSDKTHEPANISAPANSTRIHQNYCSAIAEPGQVEPTQLSVSDATNHLGVDRRLFEYAVRSVCVTGVQSLLEGRAIRSVSLSKPPV